MTERNPGELVQDIGHEFLQAAPAGWVTGELVYRRIGKTSESQATARSADGTLLNVELGRPALRALKELRAAMARPGAGTWWTAVGRFASDGRMTWEFDGADEPAWFVRVSPLHYLEEQDEFPRDEAHTPEWVRERWREAQAAAGGGAAPSTGPPGLR